jgi:phosphate transport system permease protein
MSEAMTGAPARTSAHTVTLAVPTVAAHPGSRTQGSTIVVPVPGPTAGEHRRTVGKLSREDALATVGSLAAAAALTTVVFQWLAPFDGIVGFLALFYPVFLVVYMTAVSLDHDGPAVRDRLFGALVHGMAAVVMVALVHIIAYTFWQGFPALTHVNFYHTDLSETTPLEPLTSGGVAHAIIGSLIELGIALAFTVPLGVLTAVLLNEIPGRFARLVRTIAEAATALPSIVAGLFVYAVFLVPFGGRSHGFLEQSGLAAAIAISVMMLPIIIRAADVVLRLVPGSLKEASYALGSGQWQTVWRVTLPTARSGLATAVILGTARGVGETSPVLLCAGYSLATNEDPLHHPMTSLPLAVFKLVTQPNQPMVDRGFGAASVLMLLVTVLFVTARLVARQNRSLRK